MKKKKSCKTNATNQSYSNTINQTKRRDCYKKLFNQNQKVEDKIEIIQSVTPKPEAKIEKNQTLTKKLQKLPNTRHFQNQLKEKPVTLDDDFDDDGR